MNAKRWKTKLKKAMEDAGTYRPHFEAAISALSDLLEARDTARDDWIADGAKSVIIDSNGKILKNPRLQMFNDLNATALNYWRDLGLTPKGLKAIDEAAMKPRPKSALADLLKDA